MTTFTPEESKEIVRKAIANPRSGLKENKDAWLYYKANISHVDEGYGTGYILARFAELFDGQGNLI